MSESQLERRMMTYELWLQVLVWRNDPLVYKWSRTNRPIDMTEHIEWFTMRQSRVKDEPVFSYFHGNDFIGMARLDLLTAESYEVSLIINPLYRGKGYGNLVLSDVCTFFSKEMNSTFELIATIHAQNEPSRRLFTKLGFKPSILQDNLTTYIYSKASNDSLT